MERDELKRLCGINNSARIYSQLQRDYAKVCNCHPQPMMACPCVITRDVNELLPLVNINSGHLPIKRNIYNNKYF